MAPPAKSDLCSISNVCHGHRIGALKCMQKISLFLYIELKLGQETVSNHYQRHREERSLQSGIVEYYVATTPN